MSVTIEDGVYSLLIEVKIESMFDNGKGRMIRTTDIFLVRVGMRGNLVGARRRASKSGSRWEGVGSGEKRYRVSYGMKNLRESSFLRVDKLAISATSKELQCDVIWEWINYTQRTFLNWFDDIGLSFGEEVMPNRYCISQDRTNEI